MDSSRNSLSGRAFLNCFLLLIAIIVIPIFISHFSNRSSPASVSEASLTAEHPAPDTPVEAAQFYTRQLGIDDISLEQAKLITQASDEALSLNLNVHYSGHTDFFVRTSLLYSLGLLSDLRYIDGFDNVCFVFSSDGFVDSYGNPAKSVVCTMQVNRDTMQRINYNYFISNLRNTTRQPLDAFDSYYLHPDLMDQVN